MARISDVFGIVPNGVLDVNLDKDQALYVDPLRMSLINDSDFNTRRCERLILEYMGGVDAMIDCPKQRHHVKELLSAPHEINETRLGLGKGEPKGNATSAKMLRSVFIKMKAIDGLNAVEYPEGLLTFTPHFGPDRYSDLITNILAVELVKYTRKKCLRYNIPMTSDHRLSAFNSENLHWNDIDVDLPCYEGLGVLMLPKCMVVDKYPYTSQNYINFGVLEARKLFYYREGRNLSKKAILRMETADIHDNLYKTYAWREAVRNPERFVEYLNKLRAL